MDASLLSAAWKAVAVLAIVAFNMWVIAALIVHFACSGATSCI